MKYDDDDTGIQQGVILTIDGKPPAPDPEPEPGDEAPATADGSLAERLALLTHPIALERDSALTALATAKARCEELERMLDRHHVLRQFYDKFHALAEDDVAAANVALKEKVAKLATEADLLRQSCAELMRKIHPAEAAAKVVEMVDHAAENVGLKEKVASLEREVEIKSQSLAEVMRQLHPSG